MRAMHLLCFTDTISGTGRCQAGRHPAPCGFRWGATGLLALLAMLSGAVTIRAQTNAPLLTVAQLRNDPRLTPERFARYFRDFAFKFGETRQVPSDFLAARTGDCEDFAGLASEILREKNYTTKLVAVFMKGQTHVVCYVDEIHGYLDYNLRKEASAVQLADGKLEEIADKVASYFRSPWHSASEFNNEANQPRFGRIVFAGTRTAPQADHPGGSLVRQTALSPPARQALATALPNGL